MGVKTKIAWCDSSVNLLVGCDGCELSGGHCYAESLVSRWAGKPGWPPSFRVPTLFPARLEQAIRWPDLTGKKRPDKPWLDGMPRLIFVNDLSDPFTESIDYRVWNKFIEKMADVPHRWLWLTKRPKRFAEFVDWWQRQNCERFPRNIWGGVSVTSQATLWRASELAKIDVSVRFISAEPLLGPLDLRPAWQDDECPASFLCDLLIVGGESGMNARPFYLQWARDLRGQCNACGTAFFFKQVGANAWDGNNPLCGQDCDRKYRREFRRIDDPKGGNPSEWPEDLRVQEFPKA